MRTRWLSCLLVLASLVAPAYAQDFSVGAGVGLVKPQDVNASPWFTGNVRFRPSSWIGVEPEFGYWRNTDNEQGCVPDLDVCFDADARVRDISIGANVLMIRPTGRVQPWGGAGLGAHFLETDLTFSEFDPGGSTTSTELGIHLLGGVDFNATDRVAWFAAARYDIITDTDLDQFKAYGGIRFKF